ncbi:MAG: M13 family metallopeptidase [Saprospiraceae bacterium]|nr:M13 family metallopeptidase [Saprospiraceae bacterium]
MTLQQTYLCLMVVTSACLVPGCTSEPETPASEEPTYHSGLLLQHMDTTVRPGDDFHMYVNGTWIRNTEIPADKSSYGIGMMVHEKSQEDVKRIIEESASAENQPDTDEQKVGDLYASYMDMEKRNALGISPLASEFARIDALQSHNDLPKYFAYANKLGYGTPLNLFVFPDLKQPDRYALYSWQAGLGLPDREYYLSNDGNFPEIRKEYVEHIDKMLALAGMRDTRQKAEVIMALETRIARQHMRKEETRDMMRLYNAVPTDSLDAVLPGYDWEVMLSEAGAGDVEELVITQLDYTRSLQEIIPGTDMDTWKVYLKWSVLNDAASQLSEEFDEQNFAFYGTVLNGTEEQLPQWRRAVNIVNGNLGELVGKVYVKKHFPPEAKERMYEMVDHLLKAYEASIRELAWMGEETRQQALDKLRKFTPKIGYPDKWRDYSAVEIKPDDLFGNLRRAELAEYERNINKLGGPMDKTEWGMTPQTVNAYYNPTFNEIVFPAAILQPPFFDMNADDAVNYGAIGAVIGHEIGHGFDDQGSTFDGDGALRNWWTNQDREEFKKRTALLVEQYNQFEVLEGLYVNGEFTLGENIGDLGGLSIALKAYQMSLEGKEAPVMDGFTGIQRVFLGWAQSWRSKSRDEALRTQVNTDPHSPAPFRVNGVVRNIPEFYTAFDVQPGDQLYLPPEERVKIW